MTGLSFQTDFEYTGRADKPEYVWRKYGPILEGSVLDVGADRCRLQSWLDDGTEYLGIGLGEHVDVQIDLEEEEEGIPYDDDRFQCVVCLDVLEHLDNLHEVFDELCRVSSRHVIVSLPNPWAAFMGMLRDGYYEGERRPLKWYSLPTEAPDDRHKWFYASHEAEAFLSERAEWNGMEVVQLDHESSFSNPYKERFYQMILGIIFAPDVEIESLTSGNIWALLEHKEGVTA